MAFRYIFVISALVVLTQGSYLSSVHQDSGVGVHHSGVVSSGAPVVGLPRGNSAAPQPQRPVSAHGSLAGPVGGARRVSGAGVAGSRPHGGAPRRPSAGAHGRPIGGGAHAGRPIGGGAAHGNAHQNRNRLQKPY
ncbi:translation initiation factor IF-2-like [Drosophila biarmipes]|uniref:translation initiation factor IF-2-like n=1 Tax=Drosophila biarmipes TaxID=125945 RepID=UPI0021CD047B|nr:translation initiation factor IF-2-like [Drosophila biarmipes]